MEKTIKTTNQYQECIDACNSCEKACIEGIKLCLSEPDLKKSISCIDMLNRCSSVIDQTVCLMSMNANEAKDICELCAKICEESASECSKFENDLYLYTDCVYECYTCANECRKISS